MKIRQVNSCTGQLFFQFRFMNKKLINMIPLAALLLVNGVASAETTAECEGVALLVIGEDGPDREMAVNVTFTMEMNDDKTSSWMLENEFVNPISGVGKETDNEDIPWSLQGKDDSGSEFEGNMKVLDPAYPADEYLYVLLEIKNKELMIAAPMSCELE
jgi:hypothetical protein